MKNQSSNGLQSLLKAIEYFLSNSRSNSNFCDPSNNIESIFQNSSKAKSELKQLLKSQNAFIWQGDKSYLKVVRSDRIISYKYLVNISEQSSKLYHNTLVFTEGKPAHNALLWGVRGVGKSSIVKAIWKEIAKKNNNLKIIEILRTDISTLTNLIDLIEDTKYKFIIFCDDLSFAENNDDYKSLKHILDGSLSGRPENCIFYATSNLRHLVKRNINENKTSLDIYQNEIAEDKISLTDRFGLWLGFHAIDQNDYLSTVNTYLKALNIDIKSKYFDQSIFPKLETESNREFSYEDAALLFSHIRGASSGRTAFQFITDIASYKGINLDIFYS